MTFTKEQLHEMAGKVPFWFHSIDLGQGVVTKGWKSGNHLKDELESLRLPDLSGKSVLDINAWDGFYSFEAERRGASRVVALDRMMWAMELGGWNGYWQECKEQGKVPLPFQSSPFWHPETLPGKAGFNVAHEALASRVESVVGDFMEMDITPLGQFDVVLYLGSLYHMENPLAAMRRVFDVTAEVAIIETEAVIIPGHEETALFEFFPTNELNGDVSNWWAPNEKALVGMCRAAGFTRVDVIKGAASRTTGNTLSAKLRSTVGYGLREFSLREQRPSADIHYRATVQAWK
jgi:tRNA (mo5U34)-methyltransferase